MGSAQWENLKRDKATLMEIDDVTLAGERRQFSVSSPGYVDLVITVNGQDVPLFPRDVKKLIGVLHEHYKKLDLL